MAVGKSSIPNPLLVLDVAHNEDGIDQLLEQIQLTPHDKLHMYWEW
jgi:dihydrofolate synthase/folylpolyglutamate synthase